MLGMRFGGARPRICVYGRAGSRDDSTSKYSGGNMPLARLFVFALSIVLLCGPARAQDAYPNKPVRLVVPFAAAGPADLIARIIGQKLSEEFGKQFYVENPRWRRRQHRHRPARSRAGRRPFAADQQPGDRHQRQPLQVAAVRSREGSCADYPHRQHAQCRDRASVGAGQDHEGAGRTDAQQRRQVSQLRASGRRYAGKPLG